MQSSKEQQGDKKAFLSDQCKETEENSRMGKTSNLFKKNRNTKGILHAKMGSMKERNSMDLTEAGDIKKRWQEHREKLYKKDLHDPDNQNGVTTHIEPDIVECEVKGALGSITTNTTSGGDGIPVELFQILKDDAVKVWHSICQQFRKLSRGHRTGKGQFSFQSQRKAMPKNVQTTAQLHSSHTLVLKILQARLQQYMNREFPDDQAGFRKGRGTRDQIANIHWFNEKEIVPEKHPLLLY